MALLNEVVKQNPYYARGHNVMFDLLGTNCIWRNIKNGKNETYNLEGEHQVYSAFFVKSSQSVPHNTKNETSTQTRETFTIFQQVTCHSRYVIYLIELIMCKIQHVGKSEIPFSILF